MLALSIANSKLAYIALHGASSSATSEQLASQVFLTLGVGFAVIIIASAYALWRGQMGKNEKKVVFAAIAIAFILPTLYVITLIVGHNINSYTGGPVHWHADFEVWACGEKI